MSDQCRVLVAMVFSFALIVTAAIPAAGQDNVAITKHNLDVRADTISALTDYGEVCVYCHTPHGGQVDAPLWNRTYSTASYTMYNNASSSTIDMTVDAGPTGISLACLSCHDGTVGLDVIINPPNSWSGPAPDGSQTMPVGVTNLGSDLRNDHPISVIYSTTDDAAFNAKTAVTGAGGLRLFGDGTTDRVQCASCHNPHSNVFAPFLRKSNSASALCTTCHIK